MTTLDLNTPYLPHICMSTYQHHPIYNNLNPSVPLILDYAMYDLTMLRAASKPGHYLGETMYARSDGTLAFYFTTEYLAKIATAAGFDIIQNEYATVINRNRYLQTSHVFNLSLNSSFLLPHHHTGKQNKSSVVRGCKVRW